MPKGEEAGLCDPNLCISDKAYRVIFGSVSGEGCDYYSLYDNNMYFYNDNSWVLYQTATYNTYGTWTLNGKALSINSDDGTQSFTGTMSEDCREITDGTWSAPWHDEPGCWIGEIRAW